MSQGVGVAECAVLGQFITLVVVPGAGKSIVLCCGEYGALRVGGNCTLLSSVGTCPYIVCTNICKFL